MSVNQNVSHNIQIVETVLERLAAIRVERKGWFDSEQEIEKESLAFKIGESLRCFLIARELYPEAFLSIPLDKAILNSDIRRVFTSVAKKGFFPSPYSPLPDVDDQYTDFAAFCLEFSSLVYKYSGETKNRLLQSQAEQTAKKALNFLSNSRHYYSDADGCRWAGTSTFSRKKKVNLVEYFTDVYFTSVVIIALRKVLQHPVLSLSEKDQDKIRSLIRNGGRWIVSRSDAGLLTGDENKSVKSLIYSTWGLRALVETYDAQDEDIRKLVLPIAGAYIKAIQSKVDRESVTVGQQYLYVLSPTVDVQMPYEDRSDWGGIFLTLICLRNLPGSEELLEKANYKQVLDSVYSGLLLLRDPQAKTWYKDYYILSIHHYLVEGFILYDRWAKDFGVELEITSSMLRKAIKDTLSDDSVLNLLQQLVYNNLLRIDQQAKQAKIFERAFEEFTNNSAKQSKEVKTASTTKTRKRRKR